MDSTNGIYRPALQKLLLLCAPVLCLTLMYTWLTFYQSRQQAELMAESAATRQLTEIRSQLNEALTIPIRDLTGIARTPLLTSALAETDLDRKRTLFVQSLSPLIYQNPDYFQVRWMRSNGQEGIRIDIDHPETAIRPTPVADLQDKSGRSYHQSTMALAPFQVYVSEPDLNREFGRIEIPHRPTLRIALRLPPVSGQDNGYLIINVDLDPLFQRLTDTIDQSTLQVMIASHTGDWLLHPDTSMTWASDLGHDHSLVNDDPELWQTLQTSRPGPFTLPSGHWFLARVDAARSSEAGQTPTFFLLLKEPDALIVARHQQALHRAATVLALLLLVFSIPAALFYRRELQAEKLKADLKQRARDVTNNNLFINTLANALPGLVSVWDNTEHCLYANATHQDWLGMAPDQLRGMSLKDLVGVESYPQHQLAIEQLVEGEAQTFEQTLKRPGKDNRAIQVNLIPFQDSDQKEQGFISLTTDISESMQVRQTLQSLNTTLQERSVLAEQATRVKSAFLANMSHEIRTPMNAILGLLSILTDTGLTRLQREYVGKITGAGNALLQVLNDILDLSKLEAGKLTVLNESMSIEDVVKKTMQLFELGFANKGLEQLIWIDPALPRTIKGDEHRLTQVLNNLVGNALKFTESGSVLVAAALEDVNDGQARVRFSVTDTGVGIPEQKQSFLFNAFDQADTSTTRKYGGSGLGLAICKSLVELMGGEISLSSQPDEGSEFRFTLHFEIVETEPVWSRKRLPIRRILIVEDNPASAELLRSYLTSWSVACEHVMTAEDGLQKYLAAASSGSQYDAIVVDWMLPGKDGVWLVNTLQNHATPEEPLPVIVVVTAHEQDQLEQALGRVLTSPATTLPTVLIKPVTPSALFNALTHLGQGPASGFNADSAGQALETDIGSLRSLISGSKILLVEDNELNQEVALSLLAKLGLSADTASDGVAALSLIEQEDYHLVLMDLHMPEMDGFETTRRIREQYAYHELPIIAMTAAVLEEDITRARAAGMNAHIAKPIDFQLLIQTLSHWLTEPTAAAAVEERPRPDASKELNLPEDFETNEQELLTRFQGDHDLVLRLLRSFAEQYQGGLPDPVESEERQTTLIRFFHTLKGSAATLGLIQLASLAREAEQGCRQDGERFELTPVLTALANAVNVLAPWLANREHPDTNEQSDDLDIQLKLSDIQLQISRSRLPDAKLINDLKHQVHHPKLGKQIRTLLLELDEFRYQSALVTLSDIFSQLDTEVS